MLGSHQAKVFAENFKQRLVRREGNFRCLAVQDKPNVRLLFSQFNLFV